MNGAKIEHILIKYLTNEADAEDLDFLTEWISDPDNLQLFESYVKQAIEVSFVMDKPDVKKIKEDLFNRIETESTKVVQIRPKRFLKYAAVVVLCMGIGFLINQESSKFYVQEELVPGSEPITIQLENGDVQIIKEDGSTAILENDKVVAQQDGNEINYSNSPDTEELTYNELNIPYGKKFRIVLSDGTVVHLNSGTSLRYPVKFLKGQKRQVYVTGEAYFDVVEDTEHPFVVNANNLNVQVFGTQFNVSSYEEDDTCNVVLVEGSVGLYKKEEPLENQSNVTLSPGQMGEWDEISAEFAVQSVNTHKYTGWIYGELIFRNTTFQMMEKTFERHYNIVIDNKNQELANTTFSASFRNEPIENILEYFDRVLHLDYSIENNKIIIE